MLSTPFGNKKNRKRPLFLEHTCSYTLRNTPENINIQRFYTFTLMQIQQTLTKITVSKTMQANEQHQQKTL